MITAKPPLAKVALRRNKEGGNVKGKVVRIYRIPWNTHARVTGTKDRVSQDLGSQAVPRP